MSEDPFYPCWSSRLLYTQREQINKSEMGGHNTHTEERHITKTFVNQQAVQQCLQDYQKLQQQSANRSAARKQQMQELKETYALMVKTERHREQQLQKECNEAIEALERDLQMQLDKDRAASEVLKQNFLELVSRFQAQSREEVRQNILRNQAQIDMMKQEIE